MMLCRTGQGNLLTVARDNTFIVLRPRAAEHPLDREMGVHLWHALASERGVQKCMSLLAQNGLEEMPDFALITVRGAGLHVIVRGFFTVLLLNHDGRYSSVDADGAATWREYAELPAAEFCIRGVPGLTLTGADSSYLASGVASVSILCSLGWDDPDDPVTSIEQPPTGAHNMGALLDAATAHDAPLHRDAHIPDALTPHVKAWEQRQGAVTQVMPVIEDDPRLADAEARKKSAASGAPAQPASSMQRPTPESGAHAAHAPVSPVSGATRMPQQVSSAIASGAIPLPDLADAHLGYQHKTATQSTMPPPPPPSLPRLGEATQPGLPAYVTELESRHDEAYRPRPAAPQPAGIDKEHTPTPAPPAPEKPQSLTEPHIGDSTITAHHDADDNHAGSDSDGDTSSTILTGNLVEYRQAMAHGSELPVPEDPVSTQRAVPVPALRLSNGVRIPLDRTVLIGRAPQASRLPVHELPRLVNVASPNNDVSRTHAQVRIDGELVLVTDLNSTNGLLLTEPGQQPRRLHPDEPTPLTPGTLVDLGDGVTFELEVTR
ncbi:FHA domain-containing protein [Jonesia quinghaiensis]|uniref:FHA domain-containing protein n=1 Tax=Jonesia quinghaiensis TaxID=262806 RepID=UPI000415B6E7|nr:FHA domain-containing protein [Jonesia quinghaiensis]